MIRQDDNCEPVDRDLYLRQDKNSIHGLRSGEEFEKILSNFGEFFKTNSIRNTAAMRRDL